MKVLVGTHNPGKLRMKIVVGTHNPGKLREIAALLSGTPTQVVSLTDIGHTIEADETGETFLDNAVQKAIAYSRETDDLTLADDSGLEVDALGGGPGVQSARYGGPGLNDEDRRRLLLKEIEGVPWDDRGARFVCVLALARRGVLIRTFPGVVEGLIALEPRGTGGFGYDPVFYYPPADCTFAELAPAEKDAVSHRGQALRALVGYLASIMP